MSYEILCNLYDCVHNTPVEFTHIREGKPYKGGFCSKERIALQKTGVISEGQALLICRCYKKKE